MRVERQVRDIPRVVPEFHASGGRFRLQGLEALFDRVLVRAGERGVDELARVRVARVHRKLVDVLDGAPDLVDVAEVDHRVDALAEQVQAQRDQADVAGALAVAEQAALDPVRAGQHGQFGVGDGGAAVVVGVHGQADVLAARQVPRHPLDLVRVDVRGGALDRAGQVEDDLPAGTRLPDVHHRLADLAGEVQLGVHEDLGRVLVAEVSSVAEDLLRIVHDVPGAVDRELLGLFPRVAEDHLAERRRSRVVHVHRGALGALQRLDGALDQVLPGLGQHRNADVLRDLAALDELADEVEVGLARAREADLDLLVTHLDQQVEHGPLAGGGHRVDQRLVAVAQVRGEPARRGGHDLVRPGAVGEVYRLERDVPVARHATGPLVDRRYRRISTVPHIRYTRAFCVGRASGGTRGRPLGE